MPDYRLYILNKKDRIERAVLLSCDDEKHARAEMALHMVGADGAELWLEKQLVHRIAPRPTTMP